eukprot:TRINITY_DN9661_c0_g1_i4.p5 TRINITY_DN9661_c0_g1~~TRINITY_DN9661_c0_g1_i4.p5  ORF type:complete len:130 (+),score=13.25 TRINITY_DN9661_c0_g1_i4:104-493(+)
MGKQSFRRKFRLFGRFFSLKQQKQASPTVEEEKSNSCKQNNGPEPEQKRIKQGPFITSQEVVGCKTEPVGLVSGVSPLLDNTMAQSQWGNKTALLMAGRKEAAQQATDIEEIWSQPTVVLKPWEIQCGA